MAKIKILSDSKYSKEETYQKIKNFLLNEPDLKKMTPDYKCNFTDASHSGTIKGTGFDAVVKVELAANTASVSIDVDLAFLLTPFKGKVEEILKRKIGKLVAG